MRKPRKPQGLVAWLTSAQRKELNEWFLSNDHTYAELVRRVREEFGVTTSETALGDYYHRLGRELLADQHGTVAKLPDAGIEIVIHRPQPGVWRVVVQPRNPGAENLKEPPQESAT